MSKRMLALVLTVFTAVFCLSAGAFAATNTADAVKGTPSVDGKVDAIWKSAAILKTDKWVSAEDSSYATAKLRTMWDENYFYVLAEVTDAKLSDKSANPWEKDSVEIFFDELNEKAAAYDANDSQIRVNYKNETSGGGAFDASTLKSAAKTTTSGYILEMAIPWVALKGAAKVGTVVGFDAQVNDDSLGMGIRSGTVCWNDNAGDKYCNAATLGNIKLAGAPAATADASAATLPTTGSSVPIPLIAISGICLLGAGMLLVWRKQQTSR